MITSEHNKKITAGRIKSWTQVLNDDLISGLFRFSTIWKTLGWLDIKQRYRRSVLGPFWLTISTLIMVGALGMVYSVLFKQPLAEYLPYLSVGLIVWALISSLVNESCTFFTEAEVMIKQVRLPFTVHAMRMVWRNVIIFLHNSVVLLAVIIFFVQSWHISLLTIPLAILFIAANGLFLGLILGVLCTRFRDISPIVVNITQLTFFITPIFWRAEELAERAWLVDYNPVHHFIDLVRLPIISSKVPYVSWYVVIAITLLLAVLAITVLRNYRHRIAYWV